MLCSKVQLRQQGPFCTDIKILPCRSWGCDVCAPHRRKQLMAIAASGQPNICLTLTHIFEQGSDQTLHYRQLHAAWKALVKRILRQLSKPPEKRWVMTTDEGYQYQDIRANTITRTTRAGRVKKLHYMAFAEETKSGEPHLHILLRTVFIPQQWLSQQMQELIKSPITWIEKIKGPKAAIAYVTKYVTKAPAQFGNSRRYWVSKLYQLKSKVREKRSLYDLINTKVIFQEFSELIREIVIEGSIPKVVTPTILEVYSQKIPSRRKTSDQIFASDAEGANSYLWLTGWRRQLGI